MDLSVLHHERFIQNTISVLQAACYLDDKLSGIDIVF